MRLTAGGHAEALVVDASDLAFCDGAGASLLLALRQQQESAGGSFTLRGLRDETRRTGGMTVGFDDQEAQRVTWQVQDLTSRWVHTSTQLTDLRVMTHDLGMDYLVLRRCGRDQQKCRARRFLSAPNDFDRLFVPVSLPLRGYEIYSPRRGVPIPVS